MRGATRAGDGLAISAIEHASILETANALESEGRVVRRIGVDEDGILDLDQLQDALVSHPTLVSITAVNNEIGTVQPMEEVAGVLAEHDVPLHCDLTQAAGRIPVTLNDTPVSLCLAFLPTRSTARRG